MKRFLVLALTLILVSTLSVATLATAFRPCNESDCLIEFYVKQAQPENVIKDGKIGNGEYERLDIDTNPDSSHLWITFGTSVNYIYGEEMVSTMEYYFSWDEVHGFNFAVKFKPDTIRQEIPMGNGEIPMDDFACQTAVNFVGYSALERPASDMQNCLYYTIGKSTIDSSYLEGHWGQLGPTGSYDPVELQDYIIDYSSDGVVTVEWSIPFNKIGVSGAIDTDIYFSIACTSGTELEGEYTGNSGDNYDDSIYDIQYGVNLGDYGYMRSSSEGTYFVDGIISSDAVYYEGSADTNSSTEGSTDTTNPGTEADPDYNTTTPGTEEVIITLDPEEVTVIIGGENTVNSEETENTNNTNNSTDTNSPNTTDNSVNSGTSTTPNNNNNATTSPATFDPAVLAAVASVASACAFSIFRKRR